MLRYFIDSIGEKKTGKKEGEEKRKREKKGGKGRRRLLNSIQFAFNFSFIAYHIANFPFIYLFVKFKISFIHNVDKFQTIFSTYTYNKQTKFSKFIYYFYIKRFFI